MGSEPRGTKSQKLVLSMVTSHEKDSSYANHQEKGTREYAASCLLTRPLVDLILQQEGDITPNCYAKQKQAKTTII